LAIAGDWHGRCDLKSGEDTSTRCPKWKAAGKAVIGAQGYAVLIFISR